MNSRMMISLALSASIISKRHGAHTGRNSNGRLTKSLNAQQVIHGATSPVINPCQKRIIRFLCKTVDPMLSDNRRLIDELSGYFVDSGFGKPQIFLLRALIFRPFDWPESSLATVIHLNTSLRHENRVGSSGSRALGAGTGSQTGHAGTSITSAYG